MTDKKAKLDDYYEDAGDPLAQFRRLHSGGFIEKDGKDPFEKDVDVMQYDRQQKLETDTQDMGL